MATKDNVVEIDSSLFAQCARVELELEVAATLQHKANQASIWTFNAWCETDALLDREKSLSFMQRLEQQSVEADQIKQELDAFVRDLRTQKRKLTLQLKAKVHSPEMKEAKAKVEEVVAEQTKQIADSYLVAEDAGKKPQLKIVKSGNAGKSKSKAK